MKSILPIVLSATSHEPLYLLPVIMAHFLKMADLTVYRTIQT